MPATATTPAPAEMPKMCGSASGLRVTPWRIAPDIARLAPTMMPSSTRGSRISFTIVDAEACVLAGQRAHNCPTGRRTRHRCR